MSFGEADALVVGDQLVMKVDRLRQAEKGLEQAMDVGGWEKVLAAGDVGDLLEGIIHHHGEVIGGADVLAGEDDVAEQGGIDLVDSVA